MCCRSETVCYHQPWVDDYDFDKYVDAFLMAFYISNFKIII